MRDEPLGGGREVRARGNAAASHPTSGRLRRECCRVAPDVGPAATGYFFAAAFLPAGFLRLGLGSLKALGQMSASMHSPHRGLRASHTSRP